MDPIYPVLYGLTIGLRILLEIPFGVYLLVYYMRLATEQYSESPKPAYTHKIFNKICYFATYIAFIVIMSLNLKGKF